MKFENTEVWGFRHAIRGMRNPLESWDKSDSFDCLKCSADKVDSCPYVKPFYTCFKEDHFILGESDIELAQKLIKAGNEHRKFMRQIFVSVDITAPLYYWKEFSTYKVGTVANSTSTMHKLSTTPVTIDCFETDDYKQNIVTHSNYFGDAYNVIQQCLIPFLEELRQSYLKTKNKEIWKELIRWLPESWLQTRTITMNYENIYSMIHQRKNHKLNEWSGKDNPDLPNFISWAKTLPYANELLFLDLTD